MKRYADARERNREKQRRKRARNAAHVNALKRKYDRQLRERDPNLYRARLERASAKDREFRRLFPDVAHARDRAKYQKQKNLRAVQVQRRIARKRNAPGLGVSQSEWRTVLADSLGLCAYCNERNPLTMDHIEPLSRGGAHDPDNVAAACDRCNKSKGDRPLLVWLARMAA